MTDDSGARPCHHHTLAQSPVGRVTLCPDCGVVQLHMDAVTLRLAADDFETLAHMVLMARWRLHTSAANQAAQLTAEALKAAAAPRR